MNSFRIARTALRARPAAIRAPLQRRGYAEAVSDKVGRLAEEFAGKLAMLTLAIDQVEFGSTTSGTFRIRFAYGSVKGGNLGWIGRGGSLWREFDGRYKS
jgi:hypothetical protein